METNTTVRMFGALHTVRKERGQKSTVNVAIPPEGRTGFDLAGDLELPMNKIQGIFINHKAYSLDHLIQPGDQVAFIPTGIPAPIAARGLLVPERNA
ncbi:MoaD/ThiS family protein [Geomonas sp.]|uniref:MoaD/ThiS family protein n=1 Tax=Geomonas sp. TaxID=2651584 RepID=UPI002B46D7C9|nr:MoaD/ThiS family protein [Geomonas sp.]HJV34214.1 MoaD/ThiS family protein [Geomonas sp.]